MARRSYTENMEIRNRCIYALIFSDKRCYVGQSTDPVKRFKKHSYPSSGWNELFEPVILDYVIDNVWEANRLEFSWRWAATISEWRIYSEPNIYFSNLEEITWEDVKTKGEKLIWKY